MARRAYDFGQLEDFWKGAGGDPRDARIAAAIALAESRGRNIRQRGQPYSRTGWGLWQITPGDSEPQFGVDAQLLDPHRNAEAAVTKKRQQGWDAWTTYQSGAYLDFMPAGGSSTSGGGGVPSRTGRRRKSSASWGAIALSHFAGVDQGVDFNGAGEIPALGDGRVTDVGTATIIEGGGPYSYVIYQLDNAPVNGSGFVYVAENFSPTVKRRKKLKLGDPVGEAAGTFPYIELGWNRGPTGWDPVAPLDPNPHGAKQAGRDFWAFVQATETGNVVPTGPAAPATPGTRSRPGVGGGDGWVGDVWGGIESGVQSGASDAGTLLSDAADLILSPLDFLKAMLWLVNPLNWLRAFEIAFGSILILLSIFVAIKADKLVEDVAGAAASSKIPAE